MKPKKVPPVTSSTSNTEKKTMQQQMYLEIGAVIAEIHQVVIQSIQKGDTEKARQIVKELLSAWETIRY